MKAARRSEGAHTRSTALWTGSLYYLLFFLCAGAYFPFLYVYFADLGLKGKQIGLLSTLAPLMTLLVSTPVAVFADKTRRRVRVAQVGLVCTALTVLLLRLPVDFLYIVPLMLCLAIFSTPSSSVAEGLVARMAQRRHLNFGAMRLWGSVGYAVSALGFGALWEHLGLRSMFLVAALLHLPLILVIGRLEEGPALAARRRVPARYLLKDWGLALLLAATFLAGISNSLAMTFSGVYARWLGGGDVLVGAMIAVSAVAELPTMYFAGHLAWKITYSGAALLSYVVMAVAFVGFALIDAPALLPVLSVVKGLGYGIWIPVTIRMLTSRTADEWASTAQSLLTLCLFGAAPLLAGPLGGVLHDAVSPAGVFWLAAGSLGLACVVLLTAGGWRKSQAAQREIGPEGVRSVGQGD